MTVKEFITFFEQLGIHTHGLADPFYIECFISYLKEDIQEYVFKNHPPSWIEYYKHTLEAEPILNAQDPFSFFKPKSSLMAIGSPSQPLKI